MGTLAVRHYITASLGDKVLQFNKLKDLTNISIQYSQRKNLLYPRPFYLNMIAALLGPDKIME
jgi:hypothetical protein